MPTVISDKDDKADTIEKSDAFTGLPHAPKSQGVTTSDFSDAETLQV